MNSYNRPVVFEAIRHYTESIITNPSVKILLLSDSLEDAHYFVFQLNNPLLANAVGLHNELSPTSELYFLPLDELNRNINIGKLPTNGSGSANKLRITIPQNLVDNGLHVLILEDGLEKWISHPFFVVDGEFAITWERTYGKHRTRSGEDPL